MEDAGLSNIELLDPTPLTKEVWQQYLEMVLDAARHALPADNDQPWRFLVVRERDSLERLCLRLNPWLRQGMEVATSDAEARAERLRRAMASLERVLAAPVLILIFVDTNTYPEAALYDGAVAAGNLTRAARAVRYGTCSIGEDLEGGGEDA